jgi:lipoate-protein ligase A
MELHVLPSRTAGAAENMAADFLLLQRYPQASAARFRHYEWRAPAFTFGYAQKIAFVREQLPTPAETRIDLCRRPTGGGVVDHRDDWTYALVIPRGHPLEELRATQSYRVIHEALAETLREQDVAAVTKSVADEETSGAAGVCFQQAEIFDVVHGSTGEKIAGAAQKRNKHGLLFQGSIWRPAVKNPAFDWDRFETDFVSALARVLEITAVPTPWPEWNEGELEGLIEQYASPEWIEHR